MRLLLILILTMSASNATAQTAGGREGLRFGIWNSAAQPLDETARAVLFGMSFAAAASAGIEADEPRLLGLAVSLETKRALVTVIKPVAIPGLGLPQAFDPLRQQPSERVLPGPPGTFDQLVSFVGIIGLNLNAPELAQEGLTWSIAYGGQYNGYTDVGMALRYKRKF
jgi:hypothetical protein